MKLAMYRRGNWMINNLIIREKNNKITGYYLIPCETDKNFKDKDSPTSGPLYFSFLLCPYVHMTCFYISISFLLTCHFIQEGLPDLKKLTIPHPSHPCGLLSLTCKHIRLYGVCFPPEWRLHEGKECFIAISPH